MLDGEWALIIFTILTQLAVGIWLVAVTLRIRIAKKLNQAIASQLTRPAILIVGPIMCVALLISLFHLGSPMMAFGSIANLGTSWLSREIVFSGLFLFLWISAYVNYRKANTGNILGWITTILGLLAVFSMASIYHSTPIPAWTNGNTYIGFFATTIILGSFANVTFVGFAAKGTNINQDVVKLLWKVSLFASAVVIIQLFFVPNNTGGNTYSFPLIFHGLLMLVGGLITVAFLYKCSKKQSVTLPLTVIYSTFIIIFVGEIIGRYFFYASAVPIAIG